MALLTYKNRANRQLLNLWGKFRNMNFKIVISFQLVSVLVFCLFVVFLNLLISIPVYQVECPQSYLEDLIPRQLCMHAKSLQSCLTLCDSMNCGPPGPSVHVILQARILEWVAMTSFRDLPDLGIKPTSLASPALAGGFFTTSANLEAQDNCILKIWYCFALYFFQIFVFICHCIPFFPPLHFFHLISYLLSPLPLLLLAQFQQLFSLKLAKFGLM